MSVLRFLLFPFSIIYHVITSIRNRLYDTGSRPSARFDLPVISIGNLAVGGTGKTPLTEYLIRLCTRDHNVATLSRGYGRTTRGFRITNPTDSARTVGDEPFQFFSKYGDRVTVTVGEERAMAIPMILEEHPKTDVILLDDAFQHRQVTPSLSILLTDCYRPFYEDYLLPAGRLRESRSGAARADVVVVTKCPEELSDEAMMNMEHSIRKYVDKPVFFTHIRYGPPVPYSRQEKVMRDNVIAVSGISNPKPFLGFARNNFSVVRELTFGDHHDYQQADVDKLERLLKQHPQASILTTEKDKVKLASPEFAEQVNRLSLFYIPIEVRFNKNGQDFDELVLNSLKRGPELSKN
ncbi:tetraacyldisaccharide 4'-kinase [Chryseolinea sp. T2]|uniref:tetraacyldisaccharide 4'-kinase n=1 Tax=Chryseolinea sp. T2 TaxID=3129255 RepID=UPI003077227D